MKKIRCFYQPLDTLIMCLETEHNKVPIIDAEEFAFNYVNSVLNPEKYYSTIPNENVIIIKTAQFLSEKYNTQKAIVEFAKSLPDPNDTGTVVLQSDIPTEEIDFCEEFIEYMKSK